MDYLFFLQNIRDAASHWFNEVVVFVSEFAGSAWGMAAMALVYWCIHKRAGMMLMMHYSLSYTVNGIVKNIFCVDRPFNRDPRLTPYTPATGYSFPSGHTMMAGGLYGGLAVWQRGKKWLCAFFVFMAVLTAFTRNWLGVHTIEDVAVGLLLSGCVIALNCFLMRMIDRHPERDWMLFAAAMVLVAGIFIFLPAGMKPAGMYGGVMMGWFLDRRFIHFEVRGSRKFRVVSFVLGIAVVGVCYKLLLPAVLAPLGGSLLSAMNYFLTFLLITAGWPAVIRLLEKKLHI